MEAINDREQRAAKYAALGDPVRLHLVDELALSDRSPVELRAILGIESNLLAHHLDILEAATLITRSQSSGDGRRRYVRLHRDALDGLVSSPVIEAQEAMFICTANSARSQMAAALWTQVTGMQARSAGTHPAERVHPKAVEAARRAGIDLTGAIPCSLSEITERPSLIITVCDRAHEELPRDTALMHWSITDPVGSRRRSAFDDTMIELRSWMTTVVAAEKEVA